MPDEPKIPPTALTGGLKGRNLVSAYSVSKAPNVSKRVIEGAIFEILEIGLAVGVGYSFALYIQEAAVWWVPVVFVAGFVMFSAFEPILIGDWRRRAGVAVLSAVGMLMPFVNGRVDLLGSAFGILLIFFFVGDMLSRRAYDNALRFRFSVIARSKVTKAVTGIALAAVILYFPKWEAGIDFISRAQFDGVYRLVTASGSTFSLQLDLTSTMKQFVEGIAKSRLGSEPQFAALPPDVQDSVIMQAADQILKNVQNTIGFQIGADLPVAEVMYQYLTKLFQDLRIKLGSTFTIVWAAFIFLFWRSIGALASWVVLTAGYILYESLTVAGVIGLQGESRTKEIVEFV